MLFRDFFFETNLMIHLFKVLHTRANCFTFFELIPLVAAVAAIFPFPKIPEEKRSTIVPPLCPTFDAQTTSSSANSKTSGFSLSFWLCVSVYLPRIVAKKWDPGIQDNGPFSAQIMKVEARLGKLAKIRKVEIRLGKLEVRPKKRKEKKVLT